MYLRKRTNITGKHIFSKSQKTKQKIGKIFAPFFQVLKNGTLWLLELAFLDWTWVSNSKKLEFVLWFWKNPQIWVELGLIMFILVQLVMWPLIFTAWGKNMFSTIRTVSNSTYEKKLWAARVLLLENLRILWNLWKTKKWYCLVWSHCTVEHKV